MEKVAVLTSGGLDSAVLLADIARESEAHPIYIRTGLAWEDEERRAIEKFIRALDNPNVQPLVDLSIPMQPFYDDHWGMTGIDVPKPGDTDDAVFIPGRNIILLGLASVWCSTHDVGKIAIGSLGGNPFPDATPEFFQNFGAVLSEGLGHQVTVVAPYRGHKKIDLIRENQHLPLELTLTCMMPVNDLHCGACQKCEERQDAFVDAFVDDPTEYAEHKA